MPRNFKTYSELMKLDTFEERFEYLKLSGEVGLATFGHNRYLNQALYRSPEWRKFRRDIIVRDNGCDLGVEGYDIFGKIYIHHMNPITAEDIRERRSSLMDPDQVICVSGMTHNAIHYSDSSILSIRPIERKPGDTKLW